ncbi:hypothetical protein AADG42_11240 [Ammonicoccus fulvus]|uniref:Lipoprotein n=1 Tax=Ammonicoccus fulvus TaxID=3138240 RepID=A0ABZ3FRX6_9ACTN
MIATIIRAAGTGSAVAAALVVTACSQSVEVTRAGGHPAEVQAQELLEIALTSDCETTVDHYIGTYTDDPVQREIYRRAHIDLCESDRVREALEPRQWHCAAAIFERERVSVECRPSTHSTVVVPFAYRTPDHFRGENTSISWGSIRLS